MSKISDTDRLNFLLNFLSIDDVGDRDYVRGVCVDYEAMEKRLSWGRPDENHSQRQQKSHIKTWEDDIKDVLDRAIESWGSGS